MQISAVFDRADFEAALRAAREIGSGNEPPGLAAPLDGGFWGRISEAWDAVEYALRQAFQYGIDFARKSVDSAVDTAEKLIAEAGNRARDVHEAFLARLQQYLKNMFDSALARVPTAVSVGQQLFELAQVELSQKLSMTGSLKLNITEIAAMTGAGEMTVVARYGAG